MSPRERGSISYRLWRLLHWLAYAAWPLALVHGLHAGSDAATLWVRGVDIACAAAVGTVLCWRVVALDEPAKGRSSGFRRDARSGATAPREP